MGAVKAWQMEDAEQERWRLVREWLEERLVRRVTDAEVAAMFDEFELEEALEHAMSKDD
jgi:hypothetical protein